MPHSGEPTCAVRLEEQCNAKASENDMDLSSIGGCSNDRSIQEPSFDPIESSTRMVAALEQPFILHKSESLTHFTIDSDNHTV
jgi:hypothetical protein